MLRPIHTSDIYRTISYDIYRTTVVGQSYDIVRQSYDCRTISYSDVRYLSYDKYRTILYDCRTISYDIARLSYDCRTTVVRQLYDSPTTVVRYRTISDDKYRTIHFLSVIRYRTTVVRLSYDIVRQSS